MERRTFLQYGGLSAATLASAAFADESPNDGGKTYRVLLIGAGWYGKMDLFRLIQVAPVEVVAICDVDREARENAAGMVAERQKSHNRPKTYNDYREALAESKPDLVLVDTPDHWHALPMIAAVEAGADVYVQKPIGVDVVECQAMLAAARKHKAVVQVGMQRRSTKHLMEAKERYVDSGKIGKISQVDIFSYYGGPGGPFRQDPAA